MTLKVKYLNTSHPNKRDGLLRRDIDALGEKEAVFYPSAHQYYGEWLLCNVDVWMITSLQNLILQRDGQMNGQFVKMGSLKKSTELKCALLTGTRFTIM